MIFLTKLWYTFGFLQGIVVKYSEVSKKRTVTIFKEIETDAAAIWEKEFCRFGQEQIWKEGRGDRIVRIRMGVHGNLNS